MKNWKDFERAIAKDLGLWFGCVFRRTPGSGAWGKQGQSRNAHGHHAAQDFHGDIVAPAEAHFPFSVECKAHKLANINLFLYGKCPIIEWWIQCCGDARAHNKVPMLVFKENLKTPLVAINDKTYKQLHRVKKLKLARHVTMSYQTTKGPRTIHVFMFKEFLDCVRAEYIRKFVI